MPSPPEPDPRRGLRAECRGPGIPGAKMLGNTRLADDAKQAVPAPSARRKRISKLVRWATG